MTQDNSARDGDVDWKVFGAGTEAGRLLARLYGHESKRGVEGVTYPKLRIKSQNSTEDRDRWKPSSGSKLEDKKVALFDKSKALAVKVPKVGRTNNHVISSDVIHGACHSKNKIDCLPRKKDQRSCEKEIQNNLVKSNAYRPPHQPPICSEDEKKRLNEIFAYKGGNALPEELTHPVSEVNIVDLKLKVKEERRLDAMRRNNEKCKFLLKEKEETHSLALFDDIVSEIRERKQFQVSMDALGRGETTKGQISKEISERLTKLKEIDNKRAKDVIHRLRTNEL